MILSWLRGMGLTPQHWQLHEPKRKPGRGGRKASSWPHLVSFLTSPPTPAVSLGFNSSLEELPPVWSLWSPSAPPGPCSCDHLSFEKKSEKVEGFLLVNITLFLLAAFILLTIFWKAFFLFFRGWGYIISILVHSFVYSLNRACCMPGIVMDMGTKGKTPGVCLQVHHSQRISPFPGYFSTSPLPPLLPLSA